MTKAWMANAPPKPEGKTKTFYVARADRWEHPDRDDKVMWDCMWIASSGAYEGEWRGQVFRCPVDFAAKTKTLNGFDVVEDEDFVRRTSAMSVPRAAFIERNNRADAMEGHYSPSYVKATREGTAK